MTIICPTCGFKGTPEQFQMSLSDECSCPNGCEWFLFEWPNDDEDEEDEEVSP